MTNNIYVDKYMYITSSCNVNVLPISSVGKILIIVGAIDGADRIQAKKVGRASQTDGLLCCKIW